MAANVLVFVERRDGEVKRPALEALGRARALADTLGGSVDALALGPGASDHVPSLAANGADRVFVAEDGFRDPFTLVKFTGLSIDGSATTP